MIQTWKGPFADAISKGRTPRGFPANLVRCAKRRLDRMDDARSLEELSSPPGNRLHPLTDDRAGQWAIRINDQFRICFRWGEKGPEDVEIVDYH